MNNNNLPPGTLRNVDGTPYVAELADGTNHEFFDAIRKVVREELAAVKADLVKEVLEKLDVVEKLETKVRMQVGATYFNELREKTVNDLRAEQGLSPLNFVGGICTDVIYDKDGNEVARAKTL